MKKNFFKGAALAALSLVGFAAMAQEEEAATESTFDLSGSVDTYFRTNIGGKNANNTGNGALIAPSSAFANADGFALGMANLIASKQIGKVGFVADLVFGPRGTDAVLNTTGSSNIVNQLFVTYAASDAVTLTFGNFNTFLGYEVISPAGNFNYSTSYMFSNGPFSHTGLKADFAIDDNWSVMAAILNATDYTNNNLAGKYSGGLQVGYSNDAGSAYLNVLYGNQADFDEQAIQNETFQIDLTTGWDLSEEFYLGVNATYNTTSFEGNVDDAGFYGAALYPQYAISDAFTLGLRGEYFEVFKGGLTEAFRLDDEGNGSVFATTLTGSYTAGNLTIKPELRLDSTSEDTFLEDSNGDVGKSLASFVLGAIYSF
ncbi:porin [Aquimarina agarivorans]|uniref:porin n=1 Tax=Aquimarina agarivorans TaxID=980584 RepID=UPI000248EA6D|nr:porin [Aquimarina agarivorans]